MLLWNHVLWKRWDEKKFMFNKLTYQYFLKWHLSLLYFFSWQTLKSFYMTRQKDWGFLNKLMIKFVFSWIIQRTQWLVNSLWKHFAITLNYNSRKMLMKHWSHNRFLPNGVDGIHYNVAFVFLYVFMDLKASSFIDSNCLGP